MNINKDSKWVIVGLALGALILGVVWFSFFAKGAGANWNPCLTQESIVWTPCPSVTPEPTKEPEPTVEPTVEPTGIPNVGTPNVGLSDGQSDHQSDGKSTSVPVSAPSTGRG